MAYDAWGNLVVIKNNFIHYRNRAIDIDAVNLIQAKGKRVFINHYRENNYLPKMLIMCSNTNSATGLYEYIVEKMRVATSIHNVKFPTIWTFLGCSRR